MPIENEVQKVKYRSRGYTFRYWASCDQWVPVNWDGNLRSSPVPREVWGELRRVLKAAEAARGVEGKP